MAMTKSQRTALDNLLNKGDTAGAAKLLQSLADEQAATDTAEAEKPPAEPRKPEVVMLDLFKGIHQLLGNSPALMPLINELSELIAPPAPESTDKAT